MIFSVGMPVTGQAVSTAGFMGIRAFRAEDIEEAGQMAYDVWSYELGGADPALNRFIHEYLVRYYDVNRRYSFSIATERLAAFLLAGFKKDKNDCDRWFERGLSFFSPEKRKIAQEYRSYLDRNGNAVKKIMGECDVQMGLFMSRVGGTGRMLLQNLESICRKSGVGNLFLWADATCNVQYYGKNGFEILERFENNAFSDAACLETCIFKKRLN